MTSLSGRRILIVEDEMMIALFLQDIIKELGGGVMAIAPRSAEALKLIKANPGAVDATILDVNLGDTTSHDIAATLDAHGIPFAVATGYDNAPQLAGFEGHPIIQKPYNRIDVERGLRLLPWR